MKKIIYFGLFTLVVLGLNGCGSAQPNFYNGKYYMAGDSNCKYMKIRNASSINCFNGSSQFTGWRNAMTNQQISMYQYNQQQSNYNSQQRSNRNNYNSQQQMNRNTYKYGY